MGNDIYYPNQQAARLMWYHDHADGITRLNAYAGLAAPYVLRDAFEENLIKNQIIPDHTQEIPLVIQDKFFNVDGSLGYPFIYEKASQGGRWDYGPDVIPPAVLDPSKQTLPQPSVVPEALADTIRVNGTCFPYLTLVPGVYRFRILNGSNARFYNLNLYIEATGDPGEPNLANAGPPFVQIGTDGGFLPKAVVLNKPPQPIVFDTTPQARPSATSSATICSWPRRNAPTSWKEVVRVNPNEMVVIQLKFDLPVVPFTVPFSPRL